LPSAIRLEGYIVLAEPFRSCAESRSDEALIDHIAILSVIDTPRPERAWSLSLMLVMHDLPAYIDRFYMRLLRFTSLRVNKTSRCPERPG
jgi:hypothetical protein